MSKPAALFDLDGTLADTVPLIAHHIAAAIGRFAAPVDPAAVVPYIGRPLEVPLIDLGGVAADDPLVVRMVAGYHSTWDDAVEERGPGLLFPGTRPTLEALRERGFGVGVVTAKTVSSARQLIDALGIGDLLDVVVGTDLVERGKPAPDSALLALDLLDGAPEGTWYTGDAASDIEMALAAGMRPLGITTGACERGELLAAGAEQVVDSIDQILPILTGGADLSRR